MRFNLAKTNITCPNNVEISVLFISKKLEKLTDLFAFFVSKLTFQPKSVESNLIGENLTIDQLKPFLYASYLDDVEIMVENKSTDRYAFYDVGNCKLVNDFKEQINLGLSKNDYIDEILSDIEMSCNQSN